MTDQEREIVLKMIEEGKITPEEGLKLMNALHTPAEDEQPAASAEAETPSSAEPDAVPKPETGEEKPQAEKSGFESDPRIARVKSTARRYWQIPLWIGIVILLASALGMYFILTGPGMNFWFFCLMAPLLLGVLVMAIAAGSRKARWIFVNVQQKPGEKPQRIFLGFPLPLKFTSWFLRTFRSKIPDLDREMRDKPIDKFVELIDQGFTSEEPLVVNVDEGEDGEKVQVYIG
jgi:hypothetical protein